MRLTTPDRYLAWFASIPAVLVLACSAVESADWHDWRGPNRTGITSEHSGWPKGWPPKRLWAGSVGVGSTSPVIFQGKLITLGWSGPGGRRDNPVGTDTVYCFDARTGQELWKRSYPCRYQGRLRYGDVQQYGGPCATPVIDPETKFLYTVSIDGDLRCWNLAKNGEPVWSMNFYDAYGVKKRPFVSRSHNDYGYTSAPLIRGGVLIMEVGGDEGTFMAFDKRTGKRLWRSKISEPAGHSGGPVALTVDGVPCVAALCLRKLAVIRVDKGHEGETVAEYPWATDFACNIPTPAASGSRLLVTSNYNHNESHLVEITLGGAKRAWQSKEHSKVTSPVVHKGRAYLVDGALRCLDLKTGGLLWKGGSFGYGTCLITADDKLVVFGRGRLALVDAAPDATQYRELSGAERIVRDVCYPHVALSGGIICCKDKGGRMVCLSVSGR